MNYRIFFRSFLFLALVFSTVQLTYTFEPPLLDEQASKLAKLQQMNLSIVNHWQQPGQGMRLGNANLEFDQLLQSQAANCSQQSYLFTRRVLQAGLPARRVGLWSSTGANDLMVEVKIDQHWYLFAPSVGVYFPFSLGNLVSNPKQSELYHGVPPTRGGVISWGTVFFAIKSD